MTDSASVRGHPLVREVVSLVCVSALMKLPRTISQSVTQDWEVGSRVPLRRLSSYQLKLVLYALSFCVSIFTHTGVLFSEVI